MQVKDIGLTDLHTAFQLQERLVDEIARQDTDETLLLLEHYPVYTMGSSGEMKNLLDPSIPVVLTNRGGDITFHAPGQLVGYPLINLSNRGHDLHRYLRCLEELLIRTVQIFGVDAHRVDGRTGIWTDRGKLGFIGVGVRHWITMHGFSLNVTENLAGFSHINPCGITSCPLTSLVSETGKALTVDEVKSAVLSIFDTVLDEMLPRSNTIRLRGTT